MNDVTVTVLDGIAAEETGVVTVVLEVVAGGGAAADNFRTQGAQFFIVENREGVPGGGQLPGNVGIIGKADVIAALAGGLYCVHQQHGGGIAVQRRGEIHVVGDETHLQSAGHIGRVGGRGYAILLAGLGSLLRGIGQGQFRQIGGGYQGFGGRGGGQCTGGGSLFKSQLFQGTVIDVPADCAGEAGDIEILT